jgi:4-amino-4-deoxy-L-arabinose transferase-like glycosyltransferase
MIVGLMARHILQGETPVFFYGQYYMGSLEAWLLAGLFYLFGEKITLIHILQFPLYGLYILTTWWLAKKLFDSKTIADYSALLLSIPTVLVTTYTSVSMGGYGLSLIFGNLVLIFGYTILTDKQSSARAAYWAIFGFVSGLAFWTLGMVVVYLIPVAGLILFNIRRYKITSLLMAIIAFFAGSLPWWLSFIQSSGMPLIIYLTPYQTATTPAIKILGILFLGLPSLLGFRYPWAATLSPLMLLFVWILYYSACTLLTSKLLQKRSWNLSDPRVTLLPSLCIIFFMVIIFLRFGYDSTGRYFLPLNLPLTLWIAWLADRVAGYVHKTGQRRRLVNLLIIVPILILNSVETWRAAASPDLITTQFDPITRFDNRHDQELISFLVANHETVGYSNYWVSFRLAFLSNEKIIFSPGLPYKSDMSYSQADNRIPRYSQMADENPRAAYITTRHPKLNEQLRAGFIDRQITWQEVDIGPYHVFYDISEKVRPDQLLIQ